MKKMSNTERVELVFAAVMTVGFLLLLIAACTKNDAAQMLLVKIGLAVFLIGGAIFMILFFIAQKQEKHAPDPHFRRLTELFVASEGYGVDDREIIHTSTEIVKIDTKGHLFREHRYAASDAHSMSNATAGGWTVRIGFDDLPVLIKASEDPRAKAFIGMNEHNWKDYMRRKP